MVRNVHRLYLRTRYAAESAQCRKLSAATLFADTYKRVYFYHIRKTGGSSLIRAFLAMGGEAESDVYRKLVRKPIHRVISGNTVIVGWRKFLIEEGNYSFAFSHIPAHELKLPEKTFTFSVIRDPFKRAFSHYKVLNNFAKRDKPPKHLVGTELTWLGTSMDDFLDKVPREHLLNQLYMFSKNFDVNEAFDRIMSSGHVMFTEDFDAGVEELAQKLATPLTVHHIRKSSIGEDVDVSATDRMREMLAPEFELYDKLRAEKTRANTAVG